MTYLLGALTVLLAGYVLFAIVATIFSRSGVYWWFIGKMCKRDGHDQAGRQTCPECLAWGQKTWRENHWSMRRRR